ncbi:MAG: heavy-metal-associated domain-containing protein [Gammaproteobacteria bacterium]|nr:heavy-metal-associated domain-containing protein [Gammaproteobacteria bacterium]MDH5654151.1 heavy-metal-associated domain-containing protein [Gammaproteobacteria bacterium]
MKVRFLALCLGLLFSLPVLAADSYVIKIDGMTCQFCAHNVKKRLKTIDGVEQVEVDQDKGLATLNVKPGTKLTDEQLKALIADAGYNYRGMQSQPQ